jgi:hypothetical protein
MHIRLTDLCRTLYMEESFLGHTEALSLHHFSNVVSQRCNLKAKHSNLLYIPETIELIELLQISYSPCTYFVRLCTRMYALRLQCHDCSSYQICEDPLLYEYGSC